MKTLITALAILALGLSGWVVDRLAALAPLTLLGVLVLIAGGVWAGMIWTTARRADAEAARRRRDAEFARRTRVVR